MKRKYIQPEAHILTFGGKPVMADPSLQIASGSFKDGDEQLSKKTEFNEDEFEFDLTKFIPWKDLEEN